jgi:hypothetical protein
MLSKDQAQPARLLVGEHHDELGFREIYTLQRVEKAK